MNNRMKYGHDSREGPMDFRQACRDSGLKVTHQREVIFDELARSRDHPSAESLHERVREVIPSVSLDTVYRTLALLEEADLAVRVPLGTRTARFDGDASPHHHFHCLRCGGVYDFDWEDFDRLALPGRAREIGAARSARAVVEGVCRWCPNDEKSSPET